MPNTRAPRRQGPCQRLLGSDKKKQRPRQACAPAYGTVPWAGRRLMLRHRGRPMKEESSGRRPLLEQGLIPDLGLGWVRRGHANDEARRRNSGGRLADGGPRTRQKRTG
jgi:hypothetical protein